MITLSRCCSTAVAAAVLLVTLAPLDAEAYRRGGHGHHGHHGHRGHGPGWGAVGWGLGLGVGLGWLAGSHRGHGGDHGYRHGPSVHSHVYTPGYGVVEPPVVYREVPQVVAKAPPEPVIYPRNGQNAQQIEADRQDCNRWATTQPAAMADTSVFNRATDACMDARGYTLR